MACGYVSKTLSTVVHNYDNVILIMNNRAKTRQDLGTNGHVGAGKH